MGGCGSERNLETQDEVQLSRVQGTTEPTQDHQGLRDSVHVQSPLKAKIKVQRFLSWVLCALEAAHLSPPRDLEWLWTQ